MSKLPGYVNATCPLPGEKVRVIIERDSYLAEIAAAPEQGNRIVVVHPEVMRRRGVRRLAVLSEISLTDEAIDDQLITVSFAGLERVRLVSMRTGPHFPTAAVEPFGEPPPTDDEFKEIRRLRQAAAKYLDGGTRFRALGRTDFSALDNICIAFRCFESIRLAVLAEPTIGARIAALCRVPGLNREPDEDDDDEYESLSARVKKAKLPDRVRRAVEREQNRMGGRDEEAVRHLIEVKWTPEPVKQVNLNRARQIMDRSHAGMDAVKETLLDYLASIEWGRRQGVTIVGGQNICLVGPPGTGKTSIALTLAQVLGRKLVRIPLAGVDDLYLVGADRSYTQSRPGVIARVLRSCDRHASGLLILLDEIDKVADYARRSAVPALLTLLDPEQNNAWRDHYFDEVDFDLSGTLFLTTANDEYAISAPLRDRLRVIHLTAYSVEEQVEIGWRYLLPSLKRQMAIRREVHIPKATVRVLVTDHPKSPGMRMLRQRLQLLLSRGVREHLNTGERIVVGRELARSWISPAVVVTKSRRGGWPVWVAIPPIEC